MTAHHLTILALVLLASALTLAAWVLWRQNARRRLNTQVVQQALAANAKPGDALHDDLAFLNEGPGWQRHLEGRLGRILVADEDRRLIHQSGLPYTQTQLAFLAARIGLCLLLPMLAKLVFGGDDGGARSNILPMAVGCAIGFMAPKWLIQHLAARQRARVSHELPLFVDLLGLLQSVGLSLDQSLQVVAKDFQHVMPVIGAEVARANRQYSQGRSREQAYQRMASLHDNQHLMDFAALVNQVDKHGGAIQEPIRQFSERLRVHRKSEMKALIGKITVKMTVVMVATLLPALVIVTAGPGFIAIIRSMGSITAS